MSFGLRKRRRYIRESASQVFFLIRFLSYSYSEKDSLMAPESLKRVPYPSHPLNPFPVIFNSSEYAKNVSAR